jgi:ATP-binding cassette subfamily G (WHITE) protein 1
MFAARLKLGGDNQKNEAKVAELLEELGLTNVKDVLIGSVKQKTISGGERKRTAIGVELITDPSLILLDEPTSGLDSFKALQIVKLLERQAKKGRTVVATIHQPSSEAFNIFDRLILMMDGYIVYQGRAKDSTSYFASIGHSCPVTSNPADFYMKILSVNYPKNEEEDKKL